MDIKDFILIGGGLLIAAVVVHGFWIAWKARRDPLRMDLVTHLPEADEEDELKRLRAELPNGGARVVGHSEEPWQGDLELDRDAPPGEAPVPRDPLENQRRARPAASPQVRKTEPRLDPAPETDARAERQRAPVPGKPAPAAAPEAADEAPPEQAAEPAARPRARIRDVMLPERSARADEPREPRRWGVRKSAPEPQPEQRPAARSRSTGGQAASEPRKGEPPVEELIVLNVIAPKGKPFAGPGVVEALRARGLRYGDMNIFHRVDPMTRTSLYSVANVVEPGTFDLADLDNFRSPGVCFFLQLPGPEQPMEVFEDMLKAARDVAVRVGGEVKDEQRSVMTGQTVEHYRQRISDYCRRRMSMRA